MAVEGYTVTLDTRVMDEIASQLNMSVDSLVKRAAITGETLAKTSMKPGKGRVYRIKMPSGKYRTHRASSPGSAPAVDLGALINSISVVSMGPARYRLQDAVEYGVYLEYGTRFMEKRPFLVPAADKSFEVMVKGLKGLVEK